jgi:sugar phosphate isomerase/epimerase
MQIKYVVSSMVFWWRESHISFEQECEYLKSLGYGIELWSSIKGHPECRYRNKNWSRLLQATQGMLVSMHSREDDPTLEQWAEQIECAKVLDANIVTSLRSFGIMENTSRSGYDFPAEIVKIADERGVKICIETGDLTKIKQLGEKFDSIWYCLDVGFANLDPMNNFKQYVDQLGDRIAHIHLTDNYGHDDDHEPPGLRGGIARKNWDYLLNALNKYDNEIIGSLEMCPCMPGVMIRQAQEFLFDELNWPDRPLRPAGCAAVNYNPT